jgi:hypothetical protein
MAASKYDEVSKSLNYILGALMVQIMFSGIQRKAHELWMLKSTAEVFTLYF